MLGPSSTPTQVNQQILREMLKREVPFPFPQPLIVNMNLLLLVKVYFNQLWALRERTCGNMVTNKCVGCFQEEGMKYRTQNYLLPLMLPKM